MSSQKGILARISNNSHILTDHRTMCESMQSRIRVKADDLLAERTNLDLAEVDFRAFRLKLQLAFG